MRKIINLQMEFWKKDIADIEFDLKSRDEIPKLLLGLQFIYCTPNVRDQVADILKKITPAKSRTTGRTGMDLWKILVLGTLRLNCNWDYDKVHDIANHHVKVRQMLGHEETDFSSKYGLQTIRDNVSLLIPQILDEINQVVVRAGHQLISPQKEIELRGSCDSVVVETDVHFPTDANVLFDAIRKMISIIAIVCSEIGITEWRQSHHNILKAKKLLRVIQKIKASTSKDAEKKEARERLIVEVHQEYIDVCQGFKMKAKETIRCLRELEFVSPLQDLRLKAVEEYIDHAERQMNQIVRRVVLGEKIPHEEKLFSIFEPHTEWISKGKAGVPQELGLRVCIVKDQNGFILHHQVMEKQTDDKVAVTIAQETKNRFPNFIGCSYDKGFYTPQNREQLTDILDFVALPKKGRLSEKDKEIEHSSEFKEARRKHSSVESSINALENHGLDRCRDHGLHGFKRYVGLAVLARNLEILGTFILTKKKKQESRLKAA